MASCRLNSSDSSMWLLSTSRSSTGLSLLLEDSATCCSSFAFLEKGLEGAAVRDSDGGARLTPQFRFRGPVLSVCLTLKSWTGFSGTRFSKDCDVSGGVFSFPRLQMLDLFEPSVYREHAEVVRAVMSPRGFRNGSFNGEHDCKLGLSLKDRLSGL